MQEESQEDKPPGKAVGKIPLIAVIAGLIVVVLIAAMAFALGGSEEQAADGRYPDWSETAFEDQASKRRWLYFHADWCPNCRALNADIEENLDKIPSDVVIFKVDYDDNQDLRRRYGVVRQTTVVAVDENGEKLDSFLAVGSETLQALIDRLYVEPPPSEVEGMADDMAGAPDDAPGSNQNPGSDPGGQAAEDSQDESETPETEPAAAADSTPELPSLNPRYVKWSEAAFEEHSSRQRWLNFHADWCLNCRALDADIEENLDDIPADVVIFKVDYDDNQELRQRYGINNQTTIVSVDEAGEKLDSFLAAGSETLDALIRELY